MSASTSNPSISLERRSRTSRLSPAFPSGGRSGDLTGLDSSRETRVQLGYRPSPRSHSRHVVSYATILTSEAPAELHSPPTASPLFVKRRLRSNSVLSGSSMDSHSSPRSVSTATTAAASPVLSTTASSSSSLASPLMSVRHRSSSSSGAGCDSSSPHHHLSSPTTTTTQHHHHHLPHAKSLDAQRINDTMVYLEGPHIYTCGECRTHLSTHDDVISKSFHGRNGRAYLLDQCVNVTVGPAEDRRLMTGLHTVCDIFCKRCNTLVGWTYKRAYESSQKYKEGKFIVEKIHLMLDSRESRHHHHHGGGGGGGSGGRGDRFRKRSLSWGSSTITSSFNDSMTSSDNNSMVYEY